MPGDVCAPGEDDGYRAAGEPCMVLMGDGAWRQVTLLSWRRDRRGRWVAQLEWHAQAATWTESYVHDPERLRRG